jgi:urea transport system permease protein
MRLRIFAVVVAAALIGVLTFAPWVIDAYNLTLLTHVIVFGVVAISLQLLWGRGGQLSFGHAAFFGLGAYVYAVLTVKVQLPAGVSMLLAVLLPVVVALIIGYFLFFGGVRGAYFSVITLALALIGNQVAISWSSVTGGNSGLLGVPAFVLGPLDFSGPLGAFHLSLVILVVALGIGGLVHYSRVGLIFAAIREDETRATFMGYNTSGYLTGLLALSVGIAALAGAVYAATNSFVAPDLLGALLSIEILTWVAVGGRNYVVGALLGVIVLRTINTQVSTVLPTVWPLFVGLFFVLVVLLLPAGIVGSGVRLARRLTHPRAAASTEVAS